MTNETTQAAVESTELVNDIQHVATPAKKTAPKKVAKKTAKKAPAKAAKKTEVKGKKTPAKKATKAAPAAKAEKNGEAGGLRKPQIRILLALLKKPQQTRVQLSASAPVDQAACVEYIGSPKEEVRLANDVKHFPSLVSLKLVKQEQVDIDGKDVIVYSLTAAGKKEAEKNKGK